MKLKLEITNPEGQLDFEQLGFDVDRCRELYVKVNTLYIQHRGSLLKVMDSMEFNDLNEFWMSAVLVSHISTMNQVLNSRPPDGPNISSTDIN